MAVVIPLLPVVIMSMVVPAVVVMNVTRLAVGRVEEVRLNFLDTRQVDRAATQHLV